VARLSARLGVPAHSPVIPLVIGPEAATMEAAQKLLAAGFHVGAIRPPTVPAGTCRLRVSLSAAHSARDVDALADAIVNSCGGAEFTPLPHLTTRPPWSAEWHAQQDALDAVAAAAAAAAKAGPGAWAGPGSIERAPAAAGSGPTLHLDQRRAPQQQQRRRRQQQEQEGGGGSSSRGGSGGGLHSGGGSMGSGSSGVVVAEGVHFAPLRPRGGPRERPAHVRSRM
jgi:hypothetical protein